MGAWIETLHVITRNRYHGKSHPVWVRGLKHSIIRGFSGVSHVAPRVGAWIETLVTKTRRIRKESHPVWVRGLKRPVLPQYFRFRQSHPVWVRGLKRGNGYIAQSRGRRTPCGCVD